jgi:hypothetical protein
MHKLINKSYIGTHHGYIPSETQCDVIECCSFVAFLHNNVHIVLGRHDVTILCDRLIKPQLTHPPGLVLHFSVISSNAKRICHQTYAFGGVLGWFWRRMWRVQSQLATYTQTPSKAPLLLLCMNDIFRLRFHIIRHIKWTNFFFNAFSQDVMACANVIV